MRIFFSLVFARIRASASHGRFPEVSRKYWPGPVKRPGGPTQPTIPTHKSDNASVSPCFEILLRRRLKSKVIFQNGPIRARGTTDRPKPGGQEPARRRLPAGGKEGPTVCANYISPRDTCWIFCGSMETVIASFLPADSPLIGTTCPSLDTFLRHLRSLNLIKLNSPILNY